MAKYKKKGVHPNSLNNLRKFGTKENDPSAAGKKGAVVREQKRAERKLMEQAVRAFKDLNMDIPDSETVLKIAMAKAIYNNDMDEATRIAALMMPYEKPKLASQEVHLETSIEDKTDDELHELAGQLGLVVDNTALKEDS